MSYLVLILKVCGMTNKLHIAGETYNLLIRVLSQTCAKMGRKWELEAIVGIVPAARTVALGFKNNAHHVPWDGLLQGRCVSLLLSALCVSIMPTTIVYCWLLLWVIMLSSNH